MRMLRDQRVQELVYEHGGELLLQLKDGQRNSTLLVPGSDAAVFAVADAAAVTSVRYAPPNKGRALATAVALPAVFLLVWYAAVKSLLSKDEKFVNPRATRRPTESVGFADVVSRCKVELAEIVDYLNYPERYAEAGARMPRGALLVGPSGTGKTLLARAVAGEARCSFLSASAAEFVEVYVGRGAGRIRDLFRQARDAAPAVLFLDELDALGSRPNGAAAKRGIHEEYVQTLNQLLTELDGFHGRGDGVVVLAATNRHEALDPALLRPGRFDRHVFVELPDEEERLEILRLYSSRAPMASGPHPGALEAVAAGAEGFSGAELANVVNEAVFLALRAGRPRVVEQDLRGALCRALEARRRAAKAECEPHEAGLPQGLLRRLSSAAAAVR